MKASRYVTATREVPGHPGDYFVFRLPSDDMISRAREARRLFTLKQTRATREALGPQVLAEFTEEREKARERAISRGEDPDAPSVALAKVVDAIAKADAELEDYDRTTLLTLGVAEWTVTDDQENVLEITADNVRDLDAATSKWAGLTLLGLASSGFDAAPVVMSDAGPVIDVTASHPFDDTSPSTNGSNPKEPALFPRS